MQPYTVRTRMFRRNLYWLAWFFGVLGISGLVALLMISQGPNPALIAWLILLVCVVAVLFRPRYGLYVIMFFGLSGDNALTPWYPFAKNFSSPESIFYVHNAAIISPLEVFIVLTFLSWFGRALGERKMVIHKNPLTLPMILFFVLIIIGLVYGIGTGGNINIALWEARPLFYLVAMLFLVSNLLDKREHVSHIVWAAMLSIFLKGVFGTQYFFIYLKGSLAGIEGLTDHSAAIHMNTVFILALTSWIYKLSPAKRISLLMIVPATMVTYLANQRRAAFVALALALVLMMLILYIDNRRLFWIVAPVIGLAAVVYMAAFWNSSGALGLPARAIKSTLFESQASARDQASNYYRFLENINTSFTIHQKPLTGVGFGQKFYVIVQMADISVFEWWQYFPHNSIIWIWLKTGIFGFIAMLYLVGTAIMIGVTETRKMPFNEMRAIALTGTLYLVMHFTFAYVDISWDIQSMIYVGMTMGVLCSIKRIVETPVPLPEKRWPWQPAPQPSVD